MHSGSAGDESPIWSGSGGGWGIRVKITVRRTVRVRLKVDLSPTCKVSDTVNEATLLN